MPTQEQPEPLVITSSMTAVTPTETIELTNGQVLDEALAKRLGDGKVRSLTQNKLAIPRSEFEAAQKKPAFVGPDTKAEDATVESASAKKTPAAPNQPKKPDWKAASVATLDINPAIRDSLLAGGMKTVGDVLKHGADHKTLTDIKGIDGASEKEVQQAIAKLQN